MGENGSLVKTDFVTAWQHFIICLSFIGFAVSCLFSWKLKISWKFKTSCSQSCRTDLLWTAAHFKHFSLTEPFFLKKKELWTFVLADNYADGLEAVTALLKTLEKYTWKVKLNGEMSLRLFYLRDFVESLWNVNLWLCWKIPSQSCSLQRGCLSEKLSNKVSCASSQSLAEETTGNQLCRRKGFPYSFEYNPFPLKNCWLQEVEFIASFT